MKIEISDREPPRWLVGMWRRLLKDDVHGRLTSHCAMDEAMTASESFGVKIQCENLLHEGRWFFLVEEDDRGRAEKLVVSK